MNIHEWRWILKKFIHIHECPALLLSGKSDFIGWYIKLKAQLEEKGYLTENVAITASTNEINFERKTYNFIINRLSNSVAGKLSCAQTGSATIKFLKEKYGGGKS